MGRLLGRGSVAERLKLSALVVARASRSTVSHINTNPLSRWRFTPSRTDRLLIAPQDLRTADATRATEIYAGRFAFAGKVVICDRRSPFEMAAPSAEWAAILFGFSWLRHLRAGGNAITRANARALIDDWIAVQSAGKGVAWRSDVLSRRIISWLSHAPLVLTETDARFYRRFLRSLTRQVRYLRALYKETRDGAPRLQAAIALAYAALCLQGEFKQLRGAVRRLTDELDRQVLPDGGHISRNPGTLVDLLLDLLPLRQAFNARQLPVPQSLNNAVDRMMPMLRFFRHGDGNFALFNGMGPTPADRIATLIAYDDAHGTPVSNAVHSGYQRVEAGDTVLLMDTGRPPPPAMSGEAHAGCLSFEMSMRAQRIIVNCGEPATGRENWRDFARSTAAHSTVTFNDASSCRFQDWGRRPPGVGAPIVAGPTRVTVERGAGADGATVLRASHDGYATRFSVIHQRTLTIAADGHRIDGEDLFLPTKGEAIPAKIPDDFVSRFLLHPAVRATRVADGHGVMLVLPTRESWNFHAYEDLLEVEDGAFLGGADGPRRTFQIVIRGHARQAPRLRWYLEYVPQAMRPRSAGRSHEPELPL